MAVFVLALGSSAQAADKHGLYVLGTTSYKGEVSSLIPQKVDGALKERLAGDPKVKILDKFKAESGGKPLKNAALDEAQQLYTAGIGLLVTENWSEAAKSFAASVEKFEENLADLEGYEILEDALLRQAVASYRDGKPAEAKEALRLFAMLKEDVKLDAGDYPVDLLKALDGIKKSMARSGSGTIKFESEPSGAEIVLDGDLIGQTPMTLDNVPPGLHYVVIRGKGAFPHVERVEIAGRKTQTVNANLGAGEPSAAGAGGSAAFMSELETRIGASQIDEDLNPYLAELASRTGAAAVTFVVVQKSTKGYDAIPFVFHTEKGQLARLESEVLYGDLTNTTLVTYKLSQKIVAAIGTFPEDAVVAGDPFLVAAVPVPEPPKVDPKPDPKPPVAVKPDPKPPVTVKPDPKPDPKPPVAVKPDPKPDPKPDVKPDPVTGPDNGVAIGPIGGGPPEIGDDLDDDDEWYGAWWFWTGVGAVVLTGAITGGVLLLEDDTQTTGFSATVSW